MEKPIPKRRNADNGPRLGVTPSAQVTRYLDDLVRIGLYGKTPTEVAGTLISQQIERLIREEILKLRKTR